MVPPFAASKRPRRRCVAPVNAPFHAQRVLDFFSQASGLIAIAIENALAYQELREREAKIRRLVDANIIGIYLTMPPIMRSDFWGAYGVHPLTKTVTLDTYYLGSIEKQPHSTEESAMKCGKCRCTPLSSHRRNEVWLGFRL